MNNTTVEAIELTRLYGGREAVSNVSFTLSKGQVLGFLGPNGAGKSTTMKMLTGNLAPVSYTHLQKYTHQNIVFPTEYRNFFEFRSDRSRGHHRQRSAQEPHQQRAHF